MLNGIGRLEDGLRQASGWYPWGPYVTGCGNALNAGDPIMLQLDSYDLAWMASFLRLTATPLVKGRRMVLAAASSSYPLLDIFWTILEVFLWVIWFWILITVFIDIFRSPDLSGWAKALWFLFVLFIPLIGVLVYLIVRGGSMHERSVW